MAQANQEYYELLAVSSRYVFTLLGAVVVWQAARWLRQDARARRAEIHEA